MELSFFYFGHLIIQLTNIKCKHKQIKKIYITFLKIMLDNRFRAWYHSSCIVEREFQRQ